MATSRYSTTGAADPAKPIPAGTTSNTSTSGGTTTTSPTTTNTSTSGTSTKDINTTTNTTNMTPSSLAALNTLIAQLMGGGTAIQKADRQQKQTEIATQQSKREGYSKEAAFADAKGLMAQQMRLALEKLLPSINSASIGAGASSSSMRALLTQRAGENAAENASAAGLGAAVNYGQIANGMSSVIANLIGQQDPVAAALINALSVAKGAVTNSKTIGTETTNSTGQQVQTSGGGTVTTSPTSTANSTTQMYAPMGGTQQMTLPATNFFAAPTSAMGDTLSSGARASSPTELALKQLAGLGTNQWSNYSGF